jgi:hypothetical protein
MKFYVEQNIHCIIFLFFLWLMLYFLINYWPS